MATLADGLGALQQGCASVCPSHGQGDDDEQAVQFYRICETGVFHVQAPGFAVAEQAFDIPAFAVQFQCRGRLDVGGDDQKLAIGQALGGKADGG